MAYNNGEMIIHASDFPENDSLFCSLAGFTPPLQEYRISREPAKSYIFEYIISGRGYIQTGDEILSVKAGDFCLIKKGERIISSSDPKDPYEKMWFHVEGMMLEKAVKTMIPYGVYINACDVKLAFEEIFALLDSGKSSLDRDGYVKFMSFIFSILTVATQDLYFPMKEAGSIAEAVKKYIDDNIYSDMSLEDISGHLGITKMRAIRVFKKKYETTPGQYIINKRVDIAKSLLRNTIMSLADISALLKYANTQHFSNTFKSIVGMTPGAYRKKTTRRSTKRKLPETV